MTSLRFQSQINYSLVAVPSLRSKLGSFENASKPSMLQLRLSRRRSSLRFRVRASNDDSGSGGGGGARALKGMIDALPPAVLVVRRNIGSKFAVGIYIAFVLLVIVVRKVMLKRRSPTRQGSVADLVRRGQLRADRRGISKPLEYEDPFNNPLVKVGQSNSTIEMCGKVYRLAPVKLTEEQQSEHQKRRSRAYQWTRPKVFLKEGDPIPPDVDPDSVRWVPANHPFATTTSDIDEKKAQDNVSQKHGVPSRIREEHEALQKKLEALQNGQDFNEVTINVRSIQGSEGAVSSQKSKPQEQPSSSTDQQYKHMPSNPNTEDGSGENLLPDEMKRKL
ncbi:protein MULTIPLE CHLOROPLAST DIVISION SITE 1 [Asparagus officinalis]|uniref:protein MULTIPLE CHLOROPLAST DIVISION SITE 1 n=1 Tax=Asparagus officinalis TaxID=4686 RepID=UPI00098DFA43|nr:protein MULTIPLE CHLOROPLAST DIVISION SITE 1 [Asparagus officinalis]